MQSLALVLTTQNKQQKIHQKHKIIELDYIFTGMLKAAQMTVNCPEQPGNS